MHPNSPSTNRSTRPRCAWATTDLLAEYHDEEWGRPPTTDAGWLEMIILETFQAGLSWRVVLEKRQAMREAFGQFHPHRVAELTDEDVEHLLANPRLIRNRRKIKAAIANARIAQRLVREAGSLSHFFAELKQLSEETVYDQLQTTFVGVGPVTARSIAYATGLVTPPHEEGCWLASTVTDALRVEQQGDGVQSSQPDDDVDDAAQ
ncbi:DNA-3-methyladenine glycosylase I [Alicyclobacillus kakegawensis]|uniref:DNA-3-methyladenine glycosylase I n=1 Tax=Alicyclobacillus kakegawensis TaxID=392012 RepID=UPI000835AFFC|nr:DNA-3-methyladenine glycosylase I [Alicyclobacillus kakegawensis]